MTCPHGMPTPASCVECMEDGPVVEPAAWTSVGEPFYARYGGDCRACGKRFEATALVQRWDRGDETAYTHAVHGPPISGRGGTL